MRTYVSVLLQIFICVSVLSCKEKEQTFGESEKAEIREEVQLMLSEYFAAIKKEGLQAEFDYLDNSEDFYWVPPGFISAISYDSVKTILLQNSKTLKSVDFYWETLSIYPLSRDIVTYTGIVKGNIINTEDQINSVSMIESGTVIRRESGWRILSGQSRNLTE